MKKKDYGKLLSKLIARAERSAKKGDIGNAAWVYQRISVLARRAGEWDDSVKYALLSAEYSDSDHKPFTAGWSCRSAALAAKGKGDHEATIEYALRGAERFRETGSVYAAKWCYLTAAEASKAAGKENEAIKLYSKAKGVEADDDTENEIQRLKHIVSHPRVDQYAEKDEVVEGEPVTFEVVVENHGKDDLSNISVGDRDARVSHDIERLRPGEVSIFSYKTKGKVGVLHSPYNFITWQNGKGDVMDAELKPVSVVVRPKVQINPHVYPDPVAGKTCKLVLMIKNLSGAPLTEVKADLDFDCGIDVPHPEAKEIGTIRPGEECGAGWSLRISVPGRHRIASGKIRMCTEDGTEFTETVRDIVAEVVDREMPMRPPFRKEEEFREEKAGLEKEIEAFPLAESAYVELGKKMWHQQRGYTIRGAGPDVLEKHVKENCRDMSLVAEHDFGSEKMLLYSFRMGGAHELLTAVIRKDEDFSHLILKLYSGRREGLASDLERIAGIIRHTIAAETGAREVEKVEIKKIINIIDSVVQRSRIAEGGEEGEVTEKKVRIKDSVVQRTGP